MRKLRWRKHSAVREVVREGCEQRPSTEHDGMVIAR